MTAASPSIAPKCAGAGPRSCSMGSLRAEAVGDLGSAVAPLSVLWTGRGWAVRADVLLGGCGGDTSLPTTLSLTALAGRWDISLTSNTRMVALEQRPGPPRCMLSTHACAQVLRAVSRPSPGVR